jgi:hypothetical protein
MLSNKNTLVSPILLCLLLCAQIRAQATTYTLDAGSYASLNWSDASIWQPNGVPGPNDAVIINGAETTSLNTSGDITVKSFTVNGLAYIFGAGTLTVTENLNVRYPMSWQMKLVIAAGANATMTDDNFSNPYTGIYFYTDLIVNGNLVMEAQAFSGLKVVVNGTLTQKEGNLIGSFYINPGAVLNINSPNFPVSIGRLENKGTLNWQNGILRSTNGPIINAGIWNISAVNEVLSFEGFYQDSVIFNSGTLELAPNVVSIGMTKKMVNIGTIKMNGPSKISLLALDHFGSISGPAGSVLEVSGSYFNTGSIFHPGALVDVPTLQTSNSSSLALKSGCNISSIQNFIFRSGTIELGVALPPAANYEIQAAIQTNVDQNFTGTFLLEGGSFDGNFKILFDTPNLTANFGYFGGFVAVTLSSNTIFTIKNLGVSNLINNGTMNCTQKGGLIGTSAPGIFNNGTWNIIGDSVTVLGYNNFPAVIVDVTNNGILNLKSGLATFNATMENNGVMNIDAGNTLEIAGDFVQKNAIIGQTGSKLSLYNSYTGTFFQNGAQTAGLSELSIFYGKVTFQQGTILNNISKFSVTQGTLESSIILPPASQYVFKTSTIRLNTTFQPTTVLELEDTDIEGSGNIRIGYAMNWNGGTMDVPLRIFETAQLFIQERNKRPIISSPFTNDGNVTLSGGIIEINTGFFKNAGNWNVVSEEDVIMDGYTSFTNEGIFSICGNQPIKIVFNVPFINKPTGLFKGQGSYLFNAGFTNEGAVAPGCSPGMLTIEDNLIEPAMVEIEVTGSNIGEYDQLFVNGDMKAGAVLNVVVPQGASLNGSIKVIQTSGAFTGAFSQLNMPPNFTVQYLADGVLLTSDGTVSATVLNAESGVSLSPTVASTRVLIKAQSAVAKDAVLDIYNMQGQLVRRVNWGMGNTQMELDIETLTNGLYVAKLSAFPGWKGVFVKQD